MISVLDHIEILVSKHDCVIVPGLGAFICNHSVVKSAEGIPVGLRKDTSFNLSIGHNDGLLANSISRKENISFDLANTEIANYVGALRSQLQYEGEVPMGRVGYFSKVEDDKLEFYPFTSRVANNEFFGLSAINLKPLNTIATNENIEETTKKSNIIPLSRRIARVAASIAILIGTVLVLSTPIINHNNQDYANLNAFTLKTQEALESNELYIAIPNGEEDVVLGVEDETLEVVNIDEEKGNYGIVVASLATEAQANKYISETSLTNCKVFKSQSKYRVYVARGTYDEMLSLRESNYANSDAWVCRIK